VFASLSVSRGTSRLKTPSGDHAMVEAIQVVTTTADRADAERIAASLVAKRFAACAQVSGPLEATYRWKGQVETSEEWSCTIKTLRRLFPDVERAIRELHSYEEPEILAMPIVEGSSSYLKWIEDSVLSESGTP
jgi:periplasmic divalent cation tolerance protein